MSFIWLRTNKINVCVYKLGNAQASHGHRGCMAALYPITYIYIYMHKHNNIRPIAITSLYCESSIANRIATNMYQVLVTFSKQQLNMLRSKEF